MLLSWLQHIIITTGHVGGGLEFRNSFFCPKPTLPVLGAFPTTPKVQITSVSSSLVLTFIFLSPLWQAPLLAQPPRGVLRAVAYFFVVDVVMNKIALKFLFYQRQLRNEDPFSCRPFSSFPSFVKGLL